MYKIVNAKDYTGGIEAAARYIHSKWSREETFPFYLDAVTHSSEENKPLPRFYLMLDGEKIIGSYALLINDLISRQDLYPWFACLFIEPEYRGQKLPWEMMKSAATEAKKWGFKTLYLTTDHDGYYERYGWKRMEDGYDLHGEPSRIYFWNIGD
ncbi:MAG TPA: GNAT family N-acetyltransferase [Candidatus Cloacimonadota bacterium]|nr:GNAT family N-acetyltransferase [Candidatus Cloacimonadota bacterium]